MPQGFTTVTSLAPTDVIRVIINPDTRDSQDAKITVANFLTASAVGSSGPVTFREDGLEIHTGNSLFMTGSGSTISIANGSIDMHGSINMRDADNVLMVGNAVTVRAAMTGWATPTGAMARTNFDPATITLANLAQQVNALKNDLHAVNGHGLLKA